MKKIFQKIAGEIKNNEIDNELDYFNFHQHRYYSILQLLDKIEQKKSAKLLDIGSHYLHFLLGASLLGFKCLFGSDLNIFNNKVRKRSEKFKIKLQSADLSKSGLLYQKCFFDFVLFSETIEHLNFYPLEIFNEIYRVLKPGGQVVITTPNLVRLNNRIKILLGQSINYDIKMSYDYGVHYREYTASEIKYLAKKAGFDNVKISYKHFNYPNVNYFINFLNILFGFFAPTLRSNLVIICKK